MSKTQFEYSEALMRKFGSTVHSCLDSNWVNRIYYWIVDRLNGSNLINLTYWLAPQIASPLRALEEYVIYRKWKEMDQDKAVIEILKYVHANCKYIGDHEKDKVADRWQVADETFLEKSGDCEDGAVLILVLCRLAGIPYTRIRLAASHVANPYNGMMAGHAYVKYKPEFKATGDDDTWVVLDWCWFYDHRAIGWRSKFKNLNTYREAWFEVNDWRYYGKYNLEAEFGTRTV